MLECQQEPGLCLLTWDQAYHAGDVLPPESGMERFTLTRKRNDSRDLIHVRVETWEVPHPRISGAGLIVCRLHRPGNEVAEIAMIRIGPPLEARKVVKRMTRRWLQENDFKYSNAHFGLDQITSYRVTPYAHLTQKLKDRESANGLRQALQLQARELRAELAGLLLTLRDGKRLLEKPMREIEALQEALDTSLDSAVFTALCRKIEKRNKRLARDIARLHSRKTQANEVEKRLIALRKRIKPMPAKISRLATLIEKGCVCHEFEIKAFMDTLRMIARNMFYQHLKSFQPHYDNLRDDHAVLRNLTLSPGLWVPSEEAPLICLSPGILTSRRGIQTVFEAYLAQLPDPLTPHSPPATLCITPSEQAFELAMKICQNAH